MISIDPDFKIYIPTLGRLNKQVTLKSLRVSEDLLKRVVLVVIPGEFDDHEFEYSHECEVLECPEEIKGICATRQWIIENSFEDVVFMLDDDMGFFRRHPDSMKLYKCDEWDLDEMFEQLYGWLTLHPDTPVVGLSARQGNNNVKFNYVSATRQMNFHGIHVPQFTGLGLRMDGMPVMEDFHMLLTMLTKGYANKVLYDFCWNQTGSGAEGGCSLYRDNELQATCAHRLKEDFQEFVTIVEKQSKTAWKGMETRTDVRIQWKKAYSYGLTHGRWSK